MILLLTLLVCGTLCNAKASAMTGSRSSSSARSPSFQATATAVSASPDYGLCFKTQPADAVRSLSIFSYGLLESTFTNPALKDFYNTSYDVDDFYQVIYDELKALWLHNSRSIAGSLSLVLKQSLPRVSPLLNAVTITNAISEYLAIKIVITSEEFDDYVDAFINVVSKSLRDEDGSPKSNAKAVVTAVLNYLASHGDLSYSSLHEFISILAGNYRFALYSTCSPSSFEEIVKPS